ncbi:Rne/Rng family ribonuclease [Salipaludibacillus sp. HK11]|uniref:Rne/Rng family ribonuclease n=1 Tax=Salipaludibacillus sp. HK11 TaxID=3394320 RepID=UPI0039FD9E70
MRKIILHRWMNVIRGAIVEDEKVVEWLFDTKLEGPQPGTVIRGKVIDILPGIDAAFVDIGSDKNGFLYKKELVAYHHFMTINDSDTPVKEPSITSLVTKGQWINVQVKKEETGSKGAKLTELLSFPGKYLVYLPEADYIAVSKKMKTDDIRDNWRKKAREWVENHEGVIIRTLADEAKEELVHEEFIRLKEMYSNIFNSGGNLPNKVATLYNESSILARITRDFIMDDDTTIVVDKLEDFQYIKRQLSNLHSSKVELYQGKENIFSFYELDKFLEKSVKPFVWMKNGGSLHINHTEAMTVIDVNSAKYTGKQGLRETALAINIQAAKTIAEQLRLRDVGGMVVVDFIDMDSDKDRAKVTQMLRTSLQKDRTMTNVLGFTKLGLLEMTRKKTRKPLLETTHTTCRSCNGTGQVRKAEEIARDLEEELFAMRYQEDGAFLIDIEERVNELFADNGQSRLLKLEELLSKKIFLVPVNDREYTIRFMGGLEEARKRWNERTQSAVHKQG